MGIGAFTETDGTFTLTALGHRLRRDVASSLNAVAVLAAFAAVHGAPFYECLDTHPGPATQFQAAMGAFSRLEAAAIAEAYDFAGRSAVVDVGGGNGTLLAVLLTAYPSLHGVLFDQPVVVSDAECVLTDAGVSARAHWIGGDFFSELPSGGDLYLLKSVLHN